MTIKELKNNINELDESYDAYILKGIDIFRPNNTDLEEYLLIKTEFLNNATVLKPTSPTLRTMNA